MPTALKVILGVIGAIIAFIVLIVLLGLFFIGTKESTDPSSAEKNLLLTPIDLENYFDDFSTNTADLRLSKDTFIDKSYELNAEYDTLADDHPYMFCTISVERKLSDAKAVFHTSWVTLINAFKLMHGNSETVPMQGISYGDDSKFHLIKDKEYGGIGNIFIIRNKATVYDCLLTNFYFEDVDVFKEMLEPKMQAYLEFDFYNQ